MPEEKVKVLYDAVSGSYDVGTLEEFNRKLQDPQKRRVFYDAVSSEYDLGDFDLFSEKVTTKLSLGDAVSKRINRGVDNVYAAGPGGYTKVDAPWYAKLPVQILNTLGVGRNLLANVFSDESVAESIANDRQLSETWVGFEESDFEDTPARDNNNNESPVIPERSAEWKKEVANFILDTGTDPALYVNGFTAMSVYSRIVEKVGKNATSSALRNAVREEVGRMSAAEVDQFLDEVATATKDPSALQKIRQDIESVVAEGTSREGVDVRARQAAIEQQMDEARREAQSSAQGQRLRQSLRTQERLGRLDEQVQAARASQAPQQPPPPELRALPPGPSTRFVAGEEITDATANRALVRVGDPGTADDVTLSRRKIKQAQEEGTARTLSNQERLEKIQEIRQRTRQQLAKDNRMAAMATGPSGPPQPVANRTKPKANPNATVRQWVRDSKLRIESTDIDRYGFGKGSREDRALKLQVGKAGGRSVDEVAEQALADGVIPPPPRDTNLTDWFMQKIRDNAPNEMIVPEIKPTKYGTNTIDNPAVDPALRKLEQEVDEVFGRSRPLSAGPDLADDVKRRVASFFRRYFKSGGNKPEFVQQAEVQMRGRVAKTMRQMDRHLNSLKRATKQFPNLNTEQGLQQMDAYLKGDRSIQLPQQVRAELDRMRQEIDNLSRRLIRSGIPGNRLQLTIQQNMGEYVTRSYEKFLNPKYKPKEDAVNNARALFTHTIPAEMVGELPNLNYLSRRHKLSAAGFDTIEEIAQAAPDDLVNAINTQRYTMQKAQADILAAQDLIGDIPNRIEGRIDELLAKDLSGNSFRQSLPIGRVNTANLRRRKNIDAVIRDLYGEIKDPFVNFHVTTSKMMQQLENRKFLDDIARFNEALDDGAVNKFFYRKAFKQGEQSYSVRISSEGNKALEPLDGLYTTQEIFDELKNFGVNTQMHRAWQLLIQANTVAKYTKTVTSPVTIARNFYGNIGFAVANGHYRLPYLKEAIGTTTRGLGEKIFGKAVTGEFKVLRNRFVAEGILNRQQLLDRALELGVIEDNVFSGEIKALLNDMAIAIDSGKLVSAKGIKKYLQNSTNAATELYSSMDDIWKLYGWFNEIANGQTLQEAARVVRDTYPTYSKVPRFGKEMRKFPLVGTFIAFPSEVIRVGKNISKRAMTGDWRRLIGMAAATSATYGGYKAFNHVEGITEQEAQAVREFVAPWEQNGQLFVSDIDGETFGFINSSYTDPWSYVSDPSRAVIRNLENDDPGGAFVEGVSEFLDPYLSEGLVTERVVDALRNKKKDSGAPVFNEEDPLRVKWQKSAEHIAETLVPPFTPALGTQYQRIERALQKEVSDYGKVDLLTQEAMNQLLGMRKRTVNKRQALKFEGQRLNRRLSEANRILNEGMREGATPERLRQKHAEMEAARQEIYKVFERKVWAAQTLGLSADEVAGVLVESGFSKSMVQAWMNKEYTPYSPGDDKYQRGVERFGDEFKNLFPEKTRESRTRSRSRSRRR